MRFRSHRAPQHVLLELCSVHKTSGLRTHTHKVMYEREINNTTVSVHLFAGAVQRGAYQRLEVFFQLRAPTV